MSPHFHPILADSDELPVRAIFFVIVLIIWGIKALAGLAGKASQREKERLRAVRQSIEASQRLGQIPPPPVQSTRNPAARRWCLHRKSRVVCLRQEFRGHRQNRNPRVLLQRITTPWRKRRVGRIRLPHPFHQNNPRSSKPSFSPNLHHKQPSLPCASPPPLAP